MSKILLEKGQVKLDRLFNLNREDNMSHFKPNEKIIHVSNLFQNFRKYFSFPAIKM